MVGAQCRRCRPGVQGTPIKKSSSSFPGASALIQIARDVHQEGADVRVVHVCIRAFASSQVRAFIDRGKAEERSEARSASRRAKEGTQRGEGPGRTSTNQSDRTTNFFPRCSGGYGSVLTGAASSTGCADCMPAAGCWIDGGDRDVRWGCVRCRGGLQCAGCLRLSGRRGGRRGQRKKSRQVGARKIWGRAASALVRGRTDAAGEKSGAPRFACPNDSAP